MKIIYSNIIPFKGFIAINLFGVCFVKKYYKEHTGSPMFKKMLNHESIHTAQMKEMLYVGFYLWYFTEWIVRIFINGWSNAYRNISFEKEAYLHESDKNYLEERDGFAWLNYLDNERYD